MIPESVLDFHKIKIQQLEEIEFITNQFLEENFNLGNKCILIITGKGLHSKNRVVVKPIVAKVLKKSKFISSFKSGLSEYGGQGSFIVYLK